MIRPRTASLVVALALVVGAAACGADDSADPPGESGTTSTTTEAEASESTAPEAPDDGTSEPAETSAPEGGGDLSAVLLTTDDLGEGWVESEDSDDEESLFTGFDDDESCGDASTASIPEPTEEVQVVLEDASELEVLSGSAEFAAGDAAEWMTAVLGQMEQCAEEEPLEEGQTFAVEPIAGIGEEAFGVTTAVVVEGEPAFALGITAARVGDRIVIIGSQTDAADDVDEEGLLRIVTARL